MSLDRDRIAHYRVLRILGAGAMGEVYLAEDERLARMVAVKVISSAAAGDAEMRRRFLQEAHAAASFTHANVAHIYDVGADDGLDYIAMEYVDGETLASRLARGAVPIEEIVNIAVQLVDALAAAHDRGVVHRDIKPSNVMITTRGQVKMLDFGLARVDRPSPSAGDETARQAATTPGAILGTTSYMSPEQALGEPAAAASDVFSVGVILYEMIAGRLPFAGRTVADTLHRLTSVEPDPLARFNYDLPVELERIVRKCLEKTPSQRYRSARDLLVDLKGLERDRSSGARAPRWAAATPRRAVRRTMATLLGIVVLGGLGAAIAMYVRRPAATAALPVHGDAVRSVAVLPFRITGVDDADYVTDGVTESLIDALAEHAGVRVMARSTVFRFRRSTLSPQQIGRELHVDAVVTADMQQRGDELVVLAELVSVDDGARLWGARYERRTSDLLTVEDDLARGVGGALHLDRSPRELTASGPKRDDAHALYLHGQYAMNQRTKMPEAVADFRRAIATDPSYAPPYAALASAITLLARYAAMPAAELTGARTAAEKALQLDAHLPEAHVALASVYDTCDWNWAAAEREYLAAIRLRPGDVTAHHWYALLLTRLGRATEAHQQMQLALGLDPLSPLLHLAAANIDYYAGRYDDAAADCANVAALDPSFPFLHLQKALIAIQQHRFAAARAELDASGSSAPAIAARAVLAAHEGDRVAVDRVLAQLATTNADYESAIVATALGSRDDALRLLDRACSRHNIYAGYANVDPLLAPLHGDARFTALMRRAALAPATSG
jgi:TolB-like protein/tetratricopeptide (TPR) repeat protein/predicted Ser/Thr protein kinase